MIQESRCHVLNEKPENPRGRYVLYWMQQSQRAFYNHALEAAILKANKLDLPLVVVFGLMDNYPEATERHYAFMLDGLRDVQNDLADRGIKFVCVHNEPKEAALRFSDESACVVCDRGYLNHLRVWREEVADRAGVKVVEVETDLVVPIETASDRDEFAARTLRPKIHRVWKDYLVPLKTHKPRHESTRMHLKGDFDLNDPNSVLSRIQCIRDVKRSPLFKGGYHEADRRMKAFVEKRLRGYAEGRNEPADGHTSHMSPYLQYGQISPLDLALRVMDADVPQPDRDAYLEEMIVRRELAHNHTWFNRDYGQYRSLPEWSRRSLEKHCSDRRDPQYTREQLEQARTHDVYWNAAQMEMVVTGYMHNYMRMYWGKKILEWSATPQQAYETTLYLNNRYFLDGLNPNSYGNVGWIYGLHDRPWTERPIFGQTRYMNAAGLERKFDIGRYVEQVDRLCWDYLGKGLKQVSAKS
ncbi:MAG: deoxyribodipyrimidine photo-lyase [Phycisphaerae bacterium]|nr:MAG: deoxyribodipyrimidine photo-lyase [Phycisphaerae bacterium]